MNTLIPSRQSAWWSTSSVGVSETHRELDRSLSQVRKYLASTVSGLERVETLRRLRDVVRESLAVGWDGYGATPVTPVTYAWACQFLMALPSFIPMPEPAVNPDGDISFEWYRDGQHVFAVSIDQRGLLHYSGLFGPKSTYGTDQFAGELPDEIARQIHRHLSDTD